MTSAPNYIPQFGQNDQEGYLSEEERLRRLMQGPPSMPVPPGPGPMPAPPRSAMPEQPILSPSDDALGAAIQPTATDDAIGRDPRYRAGLMQARIQQDDTAMNKPPSQTPGLDAYNRRFDQYKMAADKKVPMWRQVVGGALQAAPRFAGIGQMLMRNNEAGRIAQTLPQYQKAADEERLNRAELANENVRQDAAATNKVYRESQAEAARAAAEDRHLKMITNPNVEEEKPGEPYRGTVDVNGKKFGVLSPDVVAGRTAKAKKLAEQENWLDVPKPLRDEFGLGPKAPRETVDSVIRLLEVRSRAEEAAALKREMAAAAQKNQMDIARMGDQTRRDISTASNQTRKEIAQSSKDNKPPSSAERRAENFYIRAEDANRDLDSMQGEMAKKGLFGQLGYTYLPNWAQSDLNQSYQQAQRAFTEARLRKDSGAAIPPHEFVNDAKMYFPQPGDSSATLEQKRKSRQTILRALKQEAGRAATATGGAQEGGGIEPREQKSPSTGQYRHSLDGGKTWQPGRAPTQ